MFNFNSCFPVEIWGIAGPVDTADDHTLPVNNHTFVVDRLKVTCLKIRTTAFKWNVFRCPDSGANGSHLVIKLLIFDIILVRIM